MSCVSDIGYTAAELMRASATGAAALLRSAAMAAVAVDNANQAVSNFKKQWRIAKRGLTIAQERQAQLETVFWPRELQLLNEFAAAPIHDGVETIESVEVLGRRYAGRLIAALASRFAKSIQELRVSAPRYNTSDYRKKLQELHLTRAFAVAAARVMGRNIAWVEIQAREEVDWNRRKAVVSLGRGLMSQIAALMQSAGSAYGALGDFALSNMQSAVQEAAQAFGEYRMSRGARAAPPGGSSSGGTIGRYQGYRPNATVDNATKPGTGVTGEVGLFGTNSLMKDSSIGSHPLAWGGNGDENDHWDGRLTTSQSFEKAAIDFAKNNYFD